MEEREADKVPLQMALIRRIFTYSKPYAAKRNWLFVLTFTRGLQLPALAWLIGRTLTGPIAGRDLSGIFRCAAGYFALALFTVVNFHFRQRFALELGEAVVHDLRSDLFRKLMTMPMAFFNQTKFGRIISRMTSDIDSVRAGVQDVVFVLVVQGLQMTTSAALMAWYDWKLFSLMLVLAPVIWVVNENYRHEMSRRLRKVQESWSRVSSTLAESVSGIRVTQAFVRQEINSGFFRKLIDVHGENNVGVAQTSAVFVPLLQLKSQFFLGAMALLGAFGALRWHGWLHMEVGDLVMFFFLANLFFDPVQVIGNQLNQAFMAMAAPNGCSGCWTRNRNGRMRRTQNHCRRSGAAWNSKPCILNINLGGRCSRIFPSRWNRGSPWRWWGIPAAARRRWWGCSRNFICRWADGCWWMAWT